MIFSSRLRMWNARRAHRKIFPRSPALQYPSISETREVNDEIGRAIYQLDRCGAVGESNKDRLLTAGSIIKAINNAPGRRVRKSRPTARNL